LCSKDIQYIVFRSVPDCHGGCKTRSICIEQKFMSENPTYSGELRCRSNTKRIVTVYYSACEKAACIFSQKY
jgi:hypothetical protein